MNGRYFRDISIVRTRGENIFPLPEADEVVVFRRFMKAGLRFPLHKMLVEVLKTFEIYLHQLTPEAFIKVRVFIWDMRSQGLELDARCFYNIHELSYQTKATRKEQYHNNFGCYSFVPRSEASYPMPTFRKRWPCSWMQEWFYVKNDLSQREDVKGIIQCPIWSRFGIRRPLFALGNDMQACQTAFNIVFTYIGTRDLVQERIAYRVWPLESGWEMPKEVAAGSNQIGFVYLKYTFRYRSQFDEPNDDWLDAIEATSDELLGAYSKAEDEAMTVAFDARGRKRLNRVFDLIGFVYPDYCYLTRKQGRKRKAATSASTGVTRSKKIKVLTRRPRRIETADVPKLSERVKTTPPGIEATLVVPIGIIADLTRELVTEKVPEQPKMKVTILLKLPTTAGTPRKRRMTNVLEGVLESVNMPPSSFAEASRGITKEVPKMITASTSAHAEAGPSEVIPENHTKESLQEKPSAPAPEAPSRVTWTISFDMLRESN
jgi:hypothetical protein